MSGFDDYRKPKPGRKGACCKCGGPSEGRVSISLQARQEHPERSVKETNRITFPTVASSSRAFCESCAVEVYEKATAVLP